MRNLTKALAVVSLLAPATGQPLSIGDIELHSALNQTLNAEIKLHLSPGENPADVSVRLAPPEKFDQAGVPWSYFLSRIKFQPVVQNDGTVIVKVTSNETLTEPFLDFLLEVSWPQGNQYREFTLLIDPPVAYNQPAVPVTESRGYHPEPIEETERPVRKARPVARKAESVKVASEITPQTPTSGEYGPTGKSDTLWRIASKLGAERGVPAKQMMTALFHANPQAFSGSRMDALKSGVKLKIPETEAILKPAQKLAKAGGEEKTIPKQAAAGAKQLELVAPVESKIADKAVVSGQPGHEKGEAGGRAAGEAGKATEGKDLELQARIDKLEQQLSMMQQLLALKDQQLATLQQAGKAPPEGQAVPPAAEQPAVPPVQPPAAEQVPPKPAEPAKPEVVQPPVTAERKQEPVAKPAPAEPEQGLGAYYLTMGGLGVGILGVLGWLLWRRRKIEEQANTESMFASASEIRMPDSESLSVPVMELGSPSAYDVGTVGESSFISDFTPSDFDAFDTEQSEVDPLSEADVYLAYGRYQQAEELIRHALDAEPGRDDFKLKLLEIFYAGENKEDFATYAQKMADEGKQNDRAFWNKVTDMAKEIVPDLPLFGGTPTAAPQPPAAKADFEAGSVKSETPADVGGGETEFHDIGDFDEFKLSMPADDSTVLEELNAEFADLKRDFSEEPKADDHSLDFDLGVSGDSLAKRKEEKVAPDEGIESIDFDLDSLSFEEAPDEKTSASEGESEIETFDFNFDLVEPEKPETEAKPEKKPGLNLEEPSKPESYDFSSFDISEPEIITPSKESESSLGDIGEFDFNFDFDAPIVESKEDVVIDLGVSDLTDMDEFETKIDLAKAYMDMGDADAAKSIAEEVLSKGSKEQKVAAQAILDELK